MNSKNHKFRVHPAAIRLLTDSTWDFAHSILWDRFPFREAEIELSKLYIQEYYENIPAEKFTATAHKHFTAFCERILLAKEYVSRFSHRYIPHPCIWLNKSNLKGFAGTKAWYLKNLERRKETCLPSGTISLCENCQHKVTDSEFSRSGEAFSLNPILNHFHFRA